MSTEQALKNCDQNDEEGREVGEGAAGVQSGEMWQSIRVEPSE